MAVLLPPKYWEEACSSLFRIFISGVSLEDNRLVISYYGVKEESACSLIVKNCPFIKSYVIECEEDEDEDYSEEDSDYDEY